MTHDDIKAKCQDFCCEHLGVDHEACVDDARFDDLGADSLDRIEMGMWVEETFGVEVLDHEIDNIQQFRDMISMVERKVVIE